MGAETFRQIESGKTIRAAFNKAVDRAAYDYGHAGYTGTIAEKNDFVLILVPSDWKGTPEDYAEELIDKGDGRIDDKWGPAGAIQLAPSKWLFFGWASS